MITNPPLIMPKTIAISRQRGSGGSYVGRLVAERLKFRYIDWQLLRSAAGYLHTSSNETPTRAETQSWLIVSRSRLRSAGPSRPTRLPRRTGIYEGELFDIERRLIEEILAAATTR